MSDMRLSLRVGVAAITAGFSLAAGAQVPGQLPNSGSLLEQQRKEPVPLPLREAPVLPQQTPTKPALPPSATLKVPVKQFRITGNTVIPTSELTSLLSSEVGKTLDFDGLNDAATRIQRYYRSKGYFLAVAYLPQQQITDGTVEIAVLEGRLGRVDLQTDPKGRLRPSFVKSILDAHLKPGDIITETGLERPLLLIRDLPDTDLASALGPSKGQTGAADLSVRIQEDPRRFNGSVDFDNGGNRFTGEFRLGVTVNADNLTGFGDVLSFRGFVTDENMNFGRLAYVMPVGPYGTRLGISYNAFDYKLAKDFAALQAHGEGAVTTLYALHPLMRTRNANFLIQGALEEKRLRDFQDAAGAKQDRTVTSGRLGGIGDFRDSFLSGGLNSYSFAWTEGRVGLDSTTLTGDIATGTGLQTSGEYSKGNVDYRRLQRVTDQFNLLLAFSGQTASKNLTPAEKMSLGGPNGVRAYPVGEAPGDSGHLITAELRYNIPKYSLLGGDVTLSTFYDQGTVKTNEQPPSAFNAAGINNVRSIAGAGVGLTIGREGRFLLRGTIATPTENEAPQADRAKRDPRIWFQAVKWF